MPKKRRKRKKPKRVLRLPDLAIPRVSAFAVRSAGSRGASSSPSPRGLGGGPHLSPCRGPVAPAVLNSADRCGTVLLVEPS